MAAPDLLKQELVRLNDPVLLGVARVSTSAARRKSRLVTMRRRSLIGSGSDELADIALPQLNPRRVTVEEDRHAFSELLAEKRRVLRSAQTAPASRRSERERRRSSLAPPRSSSHSRDARLMKARLSRDLGHPALRQLRDKRKELAKLASVAEQHKSQLERSSDSIFQRSAALEDSRKALEESRNKMRGFVVQFNAKAARATRKAEKESRLRQKLERDACLLRSKLREEQAQCAATEQSAMRKRAYEEYLIGALSLRSAEFRDPPALMGKLRQHQRLNEDLGNRIDAAEVDAERLRGQLRALAKEEQAMQLAESSRLIRLRDELRDARLVSAALHKSTAERMDAYNASHDRLFRILASMQHLRERCEAVRDAGAWRSGNSRYRLSGEDYRGSRRKQHASAIDQVVFIRPVARLPDSLPPQTLQLCEQMLEEAEVGLKVVTAAKATAEPREAHQNPPDLILRTAQRDLAEIGSTISMLREIAAEARGGVPETSEPLGH